MKAASGYVVGYLAVLVGCSTEPHPSRAVDPGCTMYIGEHCNERVADVVVTAEVLVSKDGVGHLVRVTDIEPPNHPLREKAIARANRPMMYSADRAPEIIVDTFPFCEHALADIAAFGPCPSREILEERARAKGYRVRSVKVRP